MARGRKLLGAVQARGSHVDRVRLSVVPVGKRRATTLAEGPAHFIGRAVVGRLTVDEGEPSRGKGEPRDRLRARRPAARYTVADRRPQRLPGHPVSHPPAETPALAGITAHHFSLPFSVPATILAAHHSLFAVPNLAGWNVYHGYDRGVTNRLRVGVLPTVDAQGAGIYPDLEWAARAAGSATTSCSLPPAERARFARRSTETRGSLTPSSASFRDTAWPGRVAEARGARRQGAARLGGTPREPGTFGGRQTATRGRGPSRTSSPFQTRINTCFLRANRR